MSKVCVVPGCKSVQQKSLAFYEFPLTNYELSLKWLNAIKIENWVPSRTSKVCSKHFKSSDFFIFASKLKLKSNAVPCYFLPTTTTIIKSSPVKPSIECSYHVTLPPNAHFCCVWGCTINSVKQPKNAFHLLPINHQLTICDCIGLSTPIDPIEFLSKSLEICDQHYKQNAMLLYINTEITSMPGPSTKLKVIESPSPTKSSTTQTPTTTTNENDADVILNEDDLLHFDFVKAKQKNTLNVLKKPRVLPQSDYKSPILKNYLTKKPEKTDDKFYDFDEICRICLREGQLFQIYGTTYDHIYVKDMIGSCINLNNTIEKELPQKVCKKCLATLKTVYNFLNECKTSTNILLNYIKHHKDVALETIAYEHNYDKSPKKPTKINLQELMENAGINVFDTFGTNDLEATITKPEEILEDTIPADVIQKIKNTTIKESTKKIPKNVLDTITEKANLNINGKQFILAKAFTCKKCKEIFFSQDTFNEHVHTCDFKEGGVTSTKLKKCTKCLKIFKNQFQEITHNCIRKRKRRNPLQCVKCNDKFRCLSLLANHKCDVEKLALVELKRRAGKNGNLVRKTRIVFKKCKVCGEKYLTQKELTKHRKLVHPETLEPKAIRCSYCSIIFNNIDELKQHRKESHGQSRIVTCPTCMKQMTASQFSTHKLVHNIEKRFCCEFCGKRFKSTTNFRSHINRVHLGLKPYVCDICDRAYNVKSKMLEHRNVHSGIKKYMCDLCGARFTYKTCLASHLRLKRCGKTRGLAKEHQCPNCEEILKSRRLLIEHRQEVHGIKRGATRKTYSCEVCKIPCESAVDLRAHEVVHGQKEFICDQGNCRRPFFTQERLKRHLTVHETVNVQCEICSKGFYSKLSLNMHMRTHTGDKRYHCSYCPKQFTQQGHLISHTRTHTGAKPYQCPFCDRAFALNGNLTVHIRTHTGQRPYECNFCERAFFDTSSRKRHMVQKHGYGIELSMNDSN